MADTYYVMRNGKKIEVARGGKGSVEGGKFVAKANSAAASGKLPMKVDPKLAMRVKQRFAATHAWARDPKNARMLDTAVRYLIAKKHKSYTSEKAGTSFNRAINRSRRGVLPGQKRGGGGGGGGNVGKASTPSRRMPSGLLDDMDSDRKIMFGRKR